MCLDYKVKRKWSCSAMYDSLRPHWQLPEETGMGFSRQENWSGLPFPSPRDLPNPGTEPRSLTLQAYALPSKPPEKPLGLEYILQICEMKLEINNRKITNHSRYVANTHMFFNKPLPNQNSQSISKSIINWLKVKM